MVMWWKYPKLIGSCGPFLHFDWLIDLQMVGFGALLTPAKHSSSFPFTFRIAETSLVEDKMVSEYNPLHPPIFTAKNPILLLNLL